MNNHPAVKFCEVIAKKASDEGWKLSLQRRGFLWMKGGDESTLTGEEFHIMHPNPRIVAMEMFHQACCHLESHLKWNIEVVL